MSKKQKGELDLSHFKQEQVVNLVDKITPELETIAELLNEKLVTFPGETMDDFYYYITTFINANPKYQKELKIYIPDIVFDKFKKEESVRYAFGFTTIVFNMDFGTIDIFPLSRLVQAINYECYKKFHQHERIVIQYNHIQLAFLDEIYKHE